MDGAAATNTERIASAGRGGQVPRKGAFVVLARIVLGAMTMILSVNLWTGFPLLALWAGSQCSGGNVLSMTGVVIAVVTLVGLMTVGVLVLARISSSYDQLTGRTPAVRRPAPWLLSMSASKVQPARGRRDVSAIEAIVVLSVVTAFIAFEIWFFFIASSKLTA
jgi:hypothetical protein